MIIDFNLMCLALWATLSLRLAQVYIPQSFDFLMLLFSAPCIGIIVFHYSNIYRQVTRFVDQKNALRIILATTMSVLIWSLLIVLSGVVGLPRSVVIFYGALSALFIWASREIASWILKGAPIPKGIRFSEKPRSKVVIYGAGSMGVQLLQALKYKSSYEPLGFIDDTPSLWGQRVAGLKVYRPEKIDKFVISDKIHEVFLALPEASWQKKRDILRSLEKYPIMVKILPALEEIASGQVEIAALRPVDVTDLLGRETVPADPGLLQKNITGKVVMVSGAGGSIGSEISRQVLKQNPEKLVLFELSEHALYQIEMELQETLEREKARQIEPAQENNRIELIPVLGSVLDEALVEQTLTKHKVQTIYHAAAYKHVPIVEQNPLVGLKNNTFGTLCLATAARHTGVENFVLISTDKAVRPTNVMGASKRLAELILQALATESAKTVFTMVRFGNVLDSSGSVLHRFRKQIREGGPVTVTHPNIIRYFMSIPEAAELVIQAGAMAEGGDVFVLDMGKPVKIDDLARSLITLMGLEIKSDLNPKGDIEIEYTGLRPGEKLYEELLIGEDTTATGHPRIMRHLEPSLPHIELKSILKNLHNAINDNDFVRIRKILCSVVEGYGAAPLQSPSFSDWPQKQNTLH